MIDLHNHILPGIDDGAADMSVAMEMAKMHVDQGVTTVACTPHILPGVYHNDGPQIRLAVDSLKSALEEAGIILNLVTGADNHIVPTFVGDLQSGHLLTLGDTRYALLEPPHNLAPARLDELAFSLLVANYVPIITHPERLHWIEEKYSLLQGMARQGVWMQVTSGSLIGRFGRRPKYWAERMLGDGLVHILASDAHDTKKRPPDLGEGFRAVERLVGPEEAIQLVVGRPSDILANKAPDQAAPILVDRVYEDEPSKGFGERKHRRDHSGALFGRLRRILGGQ